MRVDPLSPRSPVSGVAKTARVVRSAEPVVERDETRDPDLAERRGRRPPPRFMVTANTASNASHTVLSALIDLQAAK